MRLATIDLDLLDEEIEKIKSDIDSSKKDKRTISVSTFFEIGLQTLEDLRSKCTPIIEEKNKENIPKTCLNQWEDKKYCSNEGMCLMCKII